MMITQRGRNNDKNYPDHLEDLKVDIDYQKSLTRSNSLKNQKMKNLNRSIEILKEEIIKDERDIKRHLTCLHKNKLYNDFYQIHHRNTLPIDTISPYEDLVTSEYFKNLCGHITNKSRSTFNNNQNQDKEEKTVDTDNKSILQLEQNFNRIEGDNLKSGILKFSQKTDNKITCTDNSYFDEIDVIREDLNENKIEEN